MAYPSPEKNSEECSALDLPKRVTKQSQAFSLKSQPDRNIRIWTVWRWAQSPANPSPPQIPVNRVNNGEIRVF